MITKLMFICLLPVALCANGHSVKVSRYVNERLALATYQKNLLAQQVTLRFPQSVHTIGQAVESVLAFSGYRLVPKARQSQAMQVILQQPLPEALRVIDNVTLSQCLLGLVGHSFQMLFDPVNRLISFHLKPQYAPLYADLKTEVNPGARHVKAK